MRRNKKTKPIIFLIIAIVAVVAIGATAVTYAWFVSEYNADYQFVLQSESLVVLKYDTDLTFASGTESTAGNSLVPATAKHLIAMEQQALSELDVFDTTKVQTAARVVKFTADGAFWTGNISTPGQFMPEVHAYLTSFAQAQSLSDSTLEADIAAGVKPLAANDLAGSSRNEIGYFMIFDYLGYQFLFYQGQFYIKGESAGASFVLPAAVESRDMLRYWHALSDGSTVSYNDEDVEISDGTYLLLKPNTTFSFTLYAFMSKTDEELDPVINGERISLFALLTVQ